MYDHYVALDWAQRNMAIARMTRESKAIKTVDVPSNIKEMQLYLKNLKGQKILTFEETNTSQWLYTELRGYVDDLIVCDPRRNYLLSEGPKTDRIDAEKLVQLLRANLLKPVFHTGDEFINIRNLVSGYEDVIRAGVRFQNQRSALFRSQGKKDSEKLKNPMERFVLAGIDRTIEGYEEEKKMYKQEFEKLAKKHKVIRDLTSIPGIGVIGGVKIAATVVDVSRFKSKGNFLSYCGLVKLEQMSGGRSYGKKNSRYSRTMKSVFKIAAFISAAQPGRTSFLKDYYNYLIKEKNYPEHNARNRVARRIAVLAYGVMKSGKKLDIRRLQCNSI